MVLIALQDIPYQTDSNSCGPLACLNAYNIIQKTSYVCLEEELTYLRYWIASAIDISEETVEMEENQKKFIPQKTDMPKKRKLEICKDFPGYVGREGFKSIFDQINNYEKPLHNPFIFTESESSYGEEKDSDRARNENTDSEDNTNLEIKDLEIKAFINDKNFEKKFEKHFLVVTRNLEKKIKVADMIFVYSTFRKAELNSIFENIDKKIFNSKKTISTANHLMDIFNQNDIPFKVRISWPYLWYTIGVLEALKLFIDRDGGDDLQATYRLFGSCPFHQEVPEEVSFEQSVFYQFRCKRIMYTKESGV